MSSVSSPIGFWRRLGQHRSSLGNAAMAAACCLLATRIMSQERELRAAREARTLQEEEKKMLEDRLRWLQDAVNEELKHGGKDALARIDALFATSRPAEESASKEGVAGIVQEEERRVPKDGSTPKRRFLV